MTFGILSRERVIELPDGQPASTAPTGRGRLRYNRQTNTWEVSVNGGNYISVPSGTTFAELESQGNLLLWTGQNGGWRDMIGQIVARATGPGNPSWSQMGGGPFFGYKFAVNDSVWIPYHIQHDYSLGTDILIHSHWTTSGVSVASVKWQFDYTYAKGHDQDNFDIAGLTTSVEQAAQGTPWRHMLSEIAVAISDPDFEPDGIIMTRIRRVTNGAVNNADDVFLVVADCHYQVNAFATKNRVPNFYT
jgi:hypothetical protein